MGGREKGRAIFFFRPHAASNEGRFRKERMHLVAHISRMRITTATPACPRRRLTPSPLLPLLRGPRPRRRSPARVGSRPRRAGRAVRGRARGCRVPGGIELDGAEQPPRGKERDGNAAGRHQSRSDCWRERAGWSPTHNLTHAQTLPCLLPALPLLEHLVVLLCALDASVPADLLAALAGLGLGEEGDLVPPEIPGPALEVRGLDVLLILLTHTPEKLDRERVLVQLQQQSDERQAGLEGWEKRVAWGECGKRGRPVRETGARQGKIG